MVANTRHDDNPLPFVVHRTCSSAIHLRPCTATSDTSCCQITVSQQYVSYLDAILMLLTRG